MLYQTTVSSKGQIVLPKGIRDILGLEESDVMNVSMKKGRIILEPQTRVEDMLGFVKTKKVLTRTQMKKIIRQAVEKKYFAV